MPLLQTQNNDASVARHSGRLSFGGRKFPVPVEELSAVTRTAMDRILKVRLKADSDEALMRGYQSGDETAFNALFARYEGKLYNFFLRRLGNITMSMDLYQKTWLKVHRNRGRYDSGRLFRVWLFAIAYNVLKDEFKRSAASREMLTDAVPEIPTQNRPDVALHALEQSEMRAMVERAMQALPDGQQEIILLSKYELSKYEGMKYSEIAEITGLSVGAVKQKAHRAFMTLRSQLAPYVWERERADHGM